MNEFNYSRETASENGRKDATGIRTLGMAKVARENENEIKDTSLKEKRDRMQRAISKRKELLESGEIRSTAEKFLDEPTICRAVRRFCYECNGFSNLHATNCENTNCALWLFRHGKIVPKAEELSVWQKAHKRWLQSAGELKRES